MTDEHKTMLMCDGFNKVFYCVNNEEYVLVDAEYHQGENWYVPKFITETKIPLTYSPSYIYSRYPQNGTRMEQFNEFYGAVDDTIKDCVLRTIIER